MHENYVPPSFDNHTVRNLAVWQSSPRKVRSIQSLVELGSKLDISQEQIKYWMSNITYQVLKDLEALKWKKRNKRRLPMEVRTRLLMDYAAELRSEGLII